jgi:hypothetical protein
LIKAKKRLWGDFGETLPVSWNQNNFIYIKANRLKVANFAPIYFPGPTVGQETKGVI